MGKKVKNICQRVGGFGATSVYACLMFKADAMLYPPSRATCWISGIIQGLPTCLEHIEQNSLALMLAALVWRLACMPIKFPSLAVKVVNLNPTSFRKTLFICWQNWKCFCFIRQIVCDESYLNSYLQTCWTYLEPPFLFSLYKWYCTRSRTMQ